MIKAIFFDVIGTVVDWKGTIIRDLERIGYRHERGDAAKIATEFASFYASGSFKTSKQMAEMGKGLLSTYFPEAFASPWKVAYFTNLWMRLDLWPDTLSGLAKLQKHAPCSTLSNVNSSWMASLSDNIGITWYRCLSSMDVGVKKPDPKVYQHGLRVLNVMPGEALMVAAHAYDLRAAKEQGMRTAFVNRGEEPFTDTMEFNFVVQDLNELADTLEKTRD